MYGEKKTNDVLAMAVIWKYDYNESQWDRVSIGKGVLTNYNWLNMYGCS